MGLVPPALGSSPTSDQTQLLCGREDGQRERCCEVRGLDTQTRTSQQGYAAIMMGRYVCTVVHASFLRCNEEGRFHALKFLGRKASPKTLRQHRHGLGVPHCSGALRSAH
eukprot:2532460-Rhodomonas_salina.1